ncbi:MAG: hypothetical protein P1U34_10995 [Coxiellaceae bacterium]|nr:hypothetical protein [Coxiellaceae bacterium]
MKLALPSLESSPVALLTLSAMAMGALLVSRNQLATWRLPFVRNVVFLISVTLSKLHYHPAKQPYHSDFGQITIGGMPYRNGSWASPVGNNLMRKLLSREQNLGLVVSMVQPHEQAGTGLSFFGPRLPIQPDSWQTHNIQHHACPMQDLSTDIENTQAHQAIDAMHECVLSGKSVYLHCQAGQGRSFIMLVSYFLIHGEPRLEDDAQGIPQVGHKTFVSYEQAVMHIKRIRPHVLAKPERRIKIEEIVETYHQAKPNVSFSR